MKGRKRGPYWDTIVKMKSDGALTGDIAETLGTTVRSVNSVIKRARENGSLPPFKRDNRHDPERMGVHFASVRHVFMEEMTDAEREYVLDHLDKEHETIASAMGAIVRKAIQQE